MVKRMSKYQWLMFCLWSGSLAALGPTDDADLALSGSAPVAGLIVKYRDQLASDQRVSKRVQTLAKSLNFDLRYQRPMSGGAHVLQFGEALS